MLQQFSSIYSFSPNALDDITLDEFQRILIENKKQCLFCKPSSSKKILVETPHFYVTFDDSPLLEGHLMIHTKVHYGCSGEIAEDQMEEFTLLKDSVKELIEDIYGSWSFYEHGRAGHCSISGDEVLCEHFHMHVLPLTIDISSDIKNGFKEIIFKDVREIPRYYEQYDQYLLYENKDGIHFYPVLDKIPSHFLRTIIAEKIKKPERSNWEQSTNLEMINTLKQKIKSKYESSKTVS